MSTIACSKHKKVVTKTSPFIIPFSFKRLRSFVKYNWEKDNSYDYFVHTSNKNVDNIN